MKRLFGLEPFQVLSARLGATLLLVRRALPVVTTSAEGGRHAQDYISIYRN